MATYSTSELYFNIVEMVPYGSRELVLSPTREQQPRSLAVAQREWQQTVVDTIELPILATGSIIGIMVIVETQETIYSPVLYSASLDR